MSWLRRDSSSPWDLTALLNAADGLAGRTQRHLWLARLLEWLRHAPRGRKATGANGTPSPLVRLRHLLNVLEKNPDAHARVQRVFVDFWADIQSTGLLSDFGFGPRTALYSEVWERVRLRLLPATPDTRELAELFPLLFRPEDASWIGAIDAPMLQRLGLPAWRGVEGADPWRAEMMEAVTYLASAVCAAGFSGPLRKRMTGRALANEPFHHLGPAVEHLRAAVQAGDLCSPAVRVEANGLRALLDECRAAVDSIGDHLEEFGISVDIVYEMDQLQARLRRIEQLLDCVLAAAPAPELLQLVCSLVQTLEQRRGIRSLLVRHYALLSRKVAERSAETGEHYIARTRAEYRGMLARAATGGAVLSATTLLKFGILALGLTAFWGGFWAGVNYALSFLLVMLLHGTVATKQPAMTAPAMAQRLGNLKSDAAVEAFVDDVVHLLRSQAAGIFGNLALCAPLVLAAQWAGWQLLGRPLVGPGEAEHVLHTLTLLGPTAFYAAFTGVLLFASSLIAGWAENWFVFHRLDSAIAWNPRIVARLGHTRAQRWSNWWRYNISGVAANVSLGMLLGVVPVVTAFVGLPLEVRHVTLSTGQLAAAAGALGWELLHEAAFWWCMAGIVVTGLLNIGVSFWLAFKLAARARGVRRADRLRIRAALARRLRTRLPSFLWPTAREG
ncbi:MAG: site-specific recombinase [Burkholderiaceae bacterium]